MALYGNLIDFPLSQLLNIINIARKSGTLEVNGVNGHARLLFREGRLIYTEIQGEDNSLARILFLHKRINSRQYAILKERAMRMTDRELGLVLVNAGHIGQDEILHCLRSYYLSVIRRIYALDQGMFYFNPREIPTRGKIVIQIGLENIIIESSRKVKEKEYLNGEIPSLEMCLTFLEGAKDIMMHMNLSPTEWQVISTIKPDRTIREIARAASLDEFQIRRIVYGLLQAGIVAIKRPPVPQVVVKPQAFSSAINSQEQIKTVNSLIDRIRSL